MKFLLFRFLLFQETEIPDRLFRNLLVLLSGDQESGREREWEGTLSAAAPAPVPGIPFRRTVSFETRHKKTGLPAGLPLSD